MNDTDLSALYPHHREPGHRPRLRRDPSPPLTLRAITRSSVPSQQQVAGNVAGVHILLATDADWLVDEVTAALGGPDTTFTVCRDGRAVSGPVRERRPALATVDLPVGSVELSREPSTTGEAEWRIERLVPQVSK